MSAVAALIQAFGLPAILLGVLAASAWLNRRAPYPLIGETDEEFQRRRGGGQ